MFPVRLCCVVVPTLAVLGQLFVPYGQWGYSSSAGDRAWFPMAIMTLLVTLYAWCALVLLYQALRVFVHTKPMLLQLAAMTALLVLLPLQEVILGIVANADGLTSLFQLDAYPSLVGAQVIVRAW
jgi:hypothetical protein